MAVLPAGTVRAGGGAQRPIQSRRLPGHRAGALRRMPHAAQLAGRLRPEPLPRRNPARPGRQAGPQHNARPADRHRQLERGRHYRRADRRAHPRWGLCRRPDGRSRQEHGPADRGGPAVDRRLSAVRPAGFDRRREMMWSSARQDRQAKQRQAALSYNLPSPAFRLDHLKHHLIAAARFRVPTGIGVWWRGHAGRTTPVTECHVSGPGRNTVSASNGTGRTAIGLRYCAASRAILVRRVKIGSRYHNIGIHRPAR